MSDPHLDHGTIAQGRRRLQQLLPAARAHVRKHPPKDGGGTALGDAQMSHLTEANFDALVIYPAPLGGWHSDLLLRDMPPGLPNSVGTPVAAPLRTREDAEEHSALLLQFALYIIERNRTEKATPKKPVFLLYDYKIDLQPDVLEKSLAARPELGGGYSSVEAAESRIAELLAELAPGGFKGTEGWSPEDLTRLWAVLHMAALSGLFVYPPRRDASPSGHRETSEARH